MRDEAAAITGQRLVGQRASCPLPLLRADGTQVVVDTRVVHAQWDGKPAMLAISRDISGQRGVENALRDSESLNRAIVIQADDGLELLDARTLGFVEVNEAACRALGDAREKLLAMGLPDLQVPMAILGWRPRLRPRRLARRQLPDPPPPP